VQALQWTLGFTLACAAAVPVGACAEDAPAPAGYLATGADSPIAVYASAAQADGEAAMDAGLGERVDNAALAGMSGGTMVIQHTALTGTVSNDTANHVVTGDNVIMGSSFAGEAGIPVVIQNSGNNVLIQNATVLNVQFKP
jgi:hypothetical protein